MGVHEASRFDRFVESVHKRVSRPPFFIACILVVIVWLASWPLFADAKLWHAALHSVASIITLLLVALLENAGRRDAQAHQEKLNVLAGALAALLDAGDADDNGLSERARELRESVGLEDRAGT